jgi:hypothetical protein
MGYTTDFYGEFALDEALTPAQVAYLAAFARSRRITFDEAKVAELPDPLREAVGLPVGPDGAYVVGHLAAAPFGQVNMGNPRPEGIPDYGEAVVVDQAPGRAIRGFGFDPQGEEPVIGKGQFVYGGPLPLLGRRCTMKEPDQPNDLWTHKIRPTEGPVGSSDDWPSRHGCQEGFLRSALPPEQQQPGYWCQWTPNAEGTVIAWDEGEKFYNYVEWLVYLIENFLKPWGRSLTGEVSWRGEEHEDFGRIVVRQNEVYIKEGFEAFSKEVRVSS